MPIELSNCTFELNAKYIFGDGVVFSVSKVVVIRDDDIAYVYSNNGALHNIADYNNDGCDSKIFFQPYPNPSEHFSEMYWQAVDIINSEDTVYPSAVALIDITGNIMHYIFFKKPEDMTTLSDMPNGGYQYELRSEFMSIKDCEG